MKWSQLGRLAFATAASLGLGFGLTACGIYNTLDFLYVASSRGNPGEISIYSVDSLSGAITQIPGSPTPSGGRNPVAMTASPNGQYLYVINHDDNTIVEFAIGSDGKIYPKNTYQTPGNSPDALTINAAGTFLYVVDAFQANYSAINPGPGALIVYPIKTDGSLGNPLTSPSGSFYPVCNNPVSVNVLNNGSAVYVADDPGGQLPVLGNEAASSNIGAGGASGIVYPAVGNCSANAGQINSFTVGNGGALNPVASSPFAAGVAPTSIASDPTDRFVYVADSKSNQLIGYTVQPNGVLLPMIFSVFSTGVFPDAVIVDPRGSFIYVANYSGNSISAFMINPQTGVPSLISGTGSYAVDAGPTNLLIEPGYGRYMYIANFLGNSISGLYINNPQTGTVNGVVNTPVPTLGQPTAVAVIPHGDHAVEITPQY
jgi:6-phosphogluconolactonase